METDNSTPLIEKTIFILKARPESMRGAETFLKNRGWTIKSAVDIKAMLATMATSKIQYVMICVDHPHPKARVLPKILAQAFSVDIILYADAITSQSTSLLRDIGFEYSLFPPVSGPSIDRMILKIQRDKQKRQESGGLNPTGDPTAVSSFDKLISIKGSENGGKDGNYHLDGEQSALMSLLQSGDSHDPTSQGNLSTQVAKFFSSGSGNPNQDGQAGFIPNNGSAAGSSVMGEGTGGSGHGNFSPGGPTDSSHSDYNPSGSSGGGNSNSAGGLGSSGFMNGTQGNEGSSSQAGPNHHYPSIEYGKTKQPTQVKTKSEMERGLFGGDDDSIILKGTSQAMEQSVVARPSKKQEAISVASRISCIAIQSPKFSGYLLAAFGHDRQIDSEFMTLVRKRLTAYMVAGGHEFSADDSMGLELKEVAFESWAIEKAEFLRKSLHHGHEVALAFFPKQVEEVKLEISAHEDMLSMSLDEVDAGQAVGFDVYIYLPTNDKYVRYTGRGGVLYEEQKDRLKSKGSEKIHLRKDSVQDLHRYRVQRFLNDQIAAFQKRRNEPPVSESSGF